MRNGLENGLAYTGLSMFLSIANCIPSHLQTLRTAEANYNCLNMVTKHFQTLARAGVKPCA